MTEMRNYMRVRQNSHSLFYLGSGSALDGEALFPVLRPLNRVLCIVHTTLDVKCSVWDGALPQASVSSSSGSPRLALCTLACSCDARAMSD